VGRIAKCPRCGYEGELRSPELDAIQDVSGGVKSLGPMSSMKVTCQCGHEFRVPFDERARTSRGQSWWQRLFG